MDFKTQYKAILCYMKADVMPMVSYAIIFKNKSYGFSKSTESEILAMLAKIRVVKKKLTLSSYCKLRLEINITSSQPYWAHLMIISSLYLQYDESVSFFLTRPPHRFYALWGHNFGTDSPNDLIFWLRS